ncbi:hypothetical protein FOQG_18427 [Fusarium oxysporum f. sp. raphani 54005]|nr:hypothetical protein FOQG_18427 [Fusarium oxysporum f. sp. raphani 54005]EXL65794.1 hypothetical protein FOPG_17997 [Fusarium oxysporum f. sp. conglutinans race 2 54008]KAG6989508.1 hypothetical protein FocnCong_v020911 [Fusarium oxysporum f. sp. conglutinans]KAI8404316.1 hypothetical protein FOFC_15811 [Fusarium oxysporum]
MNAKTFGRFKRTYFQTRYVMLERESLNTLIRISEHPLLGPEVRTLGLCTERLPEPDESVNGSRSFWNTLAEDSDSDQLDFWPGGETDVWFEDDDDDDILNSSYAAICRRYFDDQESFISGPDVDALTRAMSCLCNCRTLVLTDAHTPWGAMRLEREVGELERGLTYDEFDDQPFVKHVLNAMLTAAKASEIPVEELCIYLGHPDEPKATFPIGFRLLDSPPEHMRKRGSEGGLTSLTTLRLLASPTIGRTWGGDDPAPSWIHNCRRFIGFFPSLSHFSLAFEDEFDDHTAFPGLSSALSIVQLRKLELARLEVTEVQLAKLLLHHQSTLEEITLRQVSMCGMRSWATLLGKIKHMSQVRSVNLKGCWLSTSNPSGEVDCYDIDVCIKGEQDFEEAIAMMEELAMKIALEEEIDESV